ncbi:hypothetical protein RCL10_05945 [Staphylococcus lloydii]|uniref:hypothetical protein n=1 Tax=Staphylococcus lloydii TaxID=2781774 RepID=UPI002927F7CD|nr:hypothetical protein [Staphylococcus lloydii]MDU9418072.1 hypothetical protein [Staphylococcus lloydii]
MEYIVNKSLPSSVEEIKLIKVVTTIGNGTHDEPYREVEALYEKDGRLVTVLDNFKPMEDK